MADSMSSSWIRDYLLDVAETYGAQLYNTPASSVKKKVQLTDFLTYQDNSYVWAWISDKDFRVSVRISEDAACAYKRQHNRNVIDCRFSVVVISSYRPMFSPRPLSPNATGNTPVSHVSLEVGQIKLLGFGGHLFGSPRDLELDENMKEWVHGLRRDGGGGNILKLRKQELVQNKKSGPSPPSPPPFSLYAPVSQCPAIKAPEQITKPKSEQYQDLKRAYTKRWRIFESDPWKFMKEEEPPNLYPTPHRTPSPSSRVQRQGTPTDWSLSDRGSPVAEDKATAVGSEIRLHDEAEVLPTTSHLPSVLEGYATDSAITPDTHSLQPPTPAQRIRRSPPARSMSPSSEVLARSSPIPSQQLPHSSPPPLSLSIPLLSSSLPIPVGVRQNMQRKVPHPGLPVAHQDLVKQGPVQILVPNSDTSGAGSSQSYSQSQHPSRSQQSQCQLASHPLAFPSSLATDFKPLQASTPREARSDSPTRPTSKTTAESLTPRHDAELHETTPIDVKQDTKMLETSVGKQREPNSTPSKVDALEVGTSDTEEEVDQLQLTRTEAGFDVKPKTQDTGVGGAAANHEGNRIPVGRAEVQPTPQSTPPRQLTGLSAVSVIQYPSSNGHIPPVSEPTGSRGSMRSLFSGSSEDKRIILSPAPTLPVPRNVHEKADPTHIANHDPEAWKEPSFLARKSAKGKARAVGEPDVGIPSVKVSKKHRAESPVRKKAKTATGQEVIRVASREDATGIMQSPGIDASGGKIHPSNRFPTDTEATPSVAFPSSKPRLANFIVDFEKIDLGKRASIPMVDVDKDIENALLSTGRIRIMGRRIEKDGSVYLKR